jgi:hypothetical protein
MQKAGRKLKQKHEYNIIDSEVRQYIDYLCDTIDTDFDTIFANKSRLRHIVMKREVVGYLAYLKYKQIISLDLFGELIGKDHSTIIYYGKMYEKAMQGYLPENKALIDALAVAFEHNFEGSKVKYGYKGFIIHKTLLSEYYITTDSGQRLPFITSQCADAETFINGIVYWKERLEKSTFDNEPFESVEAIG